MAAGISVITLFQNNLFTFVAHTHLTITFYAHCNDEGNGGSNSGGSLVIVQQTGGGSDNNENTDPEG